MRLKRLRAASPRRVRVIFDNPVHLLADVGRYPWLGPRQRSSFEHECIIYEAAL